MAGLLNVSSVLTCPHGGQVQATTSNARVQAGGSYVLRPSDTFLISACPFVLGIVPHPCVRVQWIQPAARSQAAGDFTLTAASVGLCVATDGAAQGTVLVVSTQTQVSGL